MFNPNNPLPAAFLPPRPWNFVRGCVLWLVEVRAGVDKEDSQDEIKKAGSWKEHLPTSCWYDVDAVTAAGLPEAGIASAPRQVYRTTCGGGSNISVFLRILRVTQAELYSQEHTRISLLSILKVIHPPEHDPGIRFTHTRKRPHNPIATGHVAWPPRSKSATWELQTFYSGVCCAVPLTSSIVITSSLAFAGSTIHLDDTPCRNFKSNKIKEFEERRFEWNHDIQLGALSKFG